MTCKDCLYHEKCYSRIVYCMDIDESIGKEITDIEKRCNDFKNKCYTPLVKCIEVELDKYLGKGEEGVREEVTRKLALQIAEEIAKNESLYSIESLNDPFNPWNTKYRMTVNICYKNGQGVVKGHWISKSTPIGEKVLIRNAVVCSECGAKAPIKIIKDKYGFKRIEPILTDECPRCSRKMVGGKAE